MSAKGRFIINANTRICSKYFRLTCHQVDYDTLLSESRFPCPGRDMYFKSGVCSVITQFDGRNLDVIYSDRTSWGNRLLQHWLRIKLKECIISIAEKVLPDRMHYWEQQKGLKAKSVSVKLLRGKTLGQCFHDGRIELSPKILLMPESYTDSVILHEMAHLKYHHHRQSFWNYLSILLGEDSKAQSTRMDLEMGIKYFYLDYIIQ